MSAPNTASERQRLLCLLHEERKRFDRMLNASKEFEELHAVFTEIRQLERQLAGYPSDFDAHFETDKSGRDTYSHQEPPRA